jgi:hypothetical protein
MNLEEKVLLCHEKLKPNVKNERENEEKTSKEKMEPFFFLFFILQNKSIEREFCHRFRQQNKINRFHSFYSNTIIDA